MFDLSGKTALVTGASGDIGRAIAKALHGQGARVALTGTRAEALNQLAGELGDRAHAVAANLSDPADTERLAKDAEAALGGQLDILVNNAGITKDGLLMRMKDEDWQAVLEVNLNAGMRLSRAALRGMMKRRHGRIIGISSVVGATGIPGQANYAAAKAGMIGFSKALALENARKGVTVNCIAPGYIDTEMVTAVPEEVLKGIIGQIPVGRLGRGEEIADMVAFLAGEHAGYVTGSTLSLNGGQYMAG